MTIYQYSNTSSVVLVLYLKWQRYLFIFSQLVFSLYLTKDMYIYFL